MNAEKSQHTLQLFDQAIIIETNPFSCQLINQYNDQKVWQWKKVSYRTNSAGWQSISSARIISTTKTSCKVALNRDDESFIALNITLRDPVIAFELISESAKCSWLAVDFFAGSEEHYLGFGERFDSLDQRGKQVDLWVKNKAAGGETYIPIPFFFSNAGYGVHIDTDVRCFTRMATHDDPNVVSIRNAAASLKFALIPGLTPKEILSSYTAIAGRPKLPPDWIFGPWKSRDWQTANHAGIREDIKKQHDLNLPVTVELLDARWEVAYHTFAFDPDKFPNPQEMIDELQAHGRRLVLWISPWMAVGNGDDPDDAFYACAKRGFLIKNPKGEVYIHPLANNPMLVGSCIDFTNPDAVAWWQENISCLARMGVSGINTDFGEQIPEDAVFYDGRTGREMHNIYPRLYNVITYQALTKNEQPGVLLSRSGWHGSQRLSAIWAGDQTSDFAFSSGLRTAVIAGQSAGISGFPYWGSDIGGYFGDPTDEVYMRWAQLGAFSPVMMIHGAGRREPWTFSSQVLDVYRQYAQLHTDLFPYIQTYAAQATQTGIPIMRAMPLEFPDDPGVWGDLTEHQYCFGAELLVAPVYYGFSRERLIYLPKGGWWDFWTGEFIQGGRVISRGAEIDVIPVLARAGAIIPRLDPSPETLLHATVEGVQQAGSDLRLDVYTGADGFFQLFDGTNFSWRESTHSLTISNAPIARQVSVRRVGFPSTKVQVRSANQSIATEQASLNGEEDYTRFSVDNRDFVLTWGE